MAMRTITNTHGNLRQSFQKSLSAKVPIKKVRINGNQKHKQDKVIRHCINTPAIDHKKEATLLVISYRFTKIYAPQVSKKKQRTVFKARPISFHHIYKYKLNITISTKLFN